MTAGPVPGLVTGMAERADCAAARSPGPMRTARTTRHLERIGSLIDGFIKTASSTWRLSRQRLGRRRRRQRGTRDEAKNQSQEASPARRMMKEVADCNLGRQA